MTTTDLTTAPGVITAARALARLLEEATDAATELRVTVLGGELPGVYVEVLPGVGDEMDRTAAVDYLSALLGTEPTLAAVADRYYYQAEAESEGIAFQVLALLPQAPEPAGTAL